MKKFAICLAVLLAVSFCIHAVGAEPLRSWRTKQGGEIKAVWDRENSSDTRITLVRNADGKTYTVSVDNLCEDDQAYLRNRAAQDSEDLFGANDQADEGEAFLERLEAARLNWLENASFCGNYTFKGGFSTDDERPQFFRSEEEAMAGEIKDKNPATGFIAKLKKKYRLTCNYSQNGGDNPFGGPRLLYTVSVANDRFSLSLSRFSDGGQTSSSLVGFDDDDKNSLVRLSDEPGAALSEDCFQWPLDSPWLFFSPRINDLFKAEKGKWEYSKPEGGRVLLTFAGDSPFAQEYDEWADQPDFKVTVRYEVTVRTDMGDPVIEQANFTTYTVYDNGKKEQNSSCIKVLEWKNCGGFNVPARIRRVSQGTTGLSGRLETVWFASEWESADLGKREPNEDDFRIEVKPTDKFAHLKRLPDNNVIDLDAITDDDYDPAETNRAPAPGRPVRTRRSR